MSSGSPTKRTSRVASVQLPPSRVAIAWEMLKRADVLTRISMCIVAALAVWLITRGWQPPFAFREGDIPSRSVTARVPFQTVNVEETEQARELSRRRIITIYRHQRSELQHLREALLEKSAPGGSRRIVGETQRIRS